MSDNRTLPVPARFQAECEFCKNKLDTRSEGVHQWTSGWVMVRQGGGGHGVSLPVRENRWAHRFCVDQATRGGAGQQSLFRR